MKYQAPYAAYRFGPFHLDSSGLLFCGCNEIPLEPIQTRVLRVLLQSGGRIVTKPELIEKAWQGGAVSDESIARAIYRLRVSLGGQKDQYIKAVPRIGYRFVVSASVQNPVSVQDYALENSASVLGVFQTVRALMSDHDAMVGYWDLDLRCRSANSAYEVWFGRSQARMIGITMAELLGPLYAMNRPYIEGAIGGQSQHFKRTITLPDGRERASLASYFPDFRDGRVRGFSVLVVDADRFHEM